MTIGQYKTKPIILYIMKSGNDHCTPYQKISMIPELLERNHLHETD